MARQESDREDLLREATALVERIELSLGATGSARLTSASSARLSSPKSARAVEAAAAESAVAGFRKNGAASFYFGADPVYQFNAAGAFRRGYCNGRLIKATHGKLVSLKRERREDQVHLLSRELATEEQLALLLSITFRLDKLAGDLAAGRYSIVGQVPAEADVLGRLRRWLATHVPLPQIARSPRADA